MPLDQGDALANYGFHIEIDGVDIAHFKKISGLSVEIQAIEYKHNLKGGRTHLRQLPGAVKWQPVVCERGMGDSESFQKWIKEVQEGVKSARRNASIVVFDFESGETKRYNLLNCWPSKLEAGELEAGGSNIVMEKLTLVHEGLEFA